MKNYTQLCYTALILAVFTACNSVGAPLDCSKKDREYHIRGCNNRVAEMRKMKNRDKTLNPNAHCHLDGHNPTILCAVLNDYSKVIEYLLQEDGDADPNIQLPKYNNGTALMVAAYKGYISSTKALLKGGKKPESKADPNLRNDDGFTALIKAAERGHTNVVNALLDGGATPDLQTFEKKATALIIAAANGNTSTVSTLIAAGANLDLSTNTDETALLLAIYNGHVGVVRALAQAGADLYASNSAGLTPFGAILTHTMKKNPKAGNQMATILLESGLDPNSFC